MFYGKVLRKSFKAKEIFTRDLVRTRSFVKILLFTFLCCTGTFLISLLACYIIVVNPYLYFNCFRK